MFKPTVDAADAASVLFNLPEAACPACGVLTRRVHQRTRQRVRDVDFDGTVRVWWIKKRWRCAEPLCGTVTFTQHTAQVPPRARLTARLKGRIVGALSGEVRAVSRVAVEHGISWPTVMRQLAIAQAAQAARAAARPGLVLNLGIDEHRFRTVRWYKDDDQKWRRVEPWMTTLTDLFTGRVIGVVDGRDSAAVQAWLKDQPRWWRHRVATVAIDPSASFRSAVRHWLPKARVSVDHFHLVKLANDVVTQVRRRVSWDRRGRGVDLAWANRLLLLRAYNTLSEPGVQKLNRVFAVDDPTHQISAAWGVKEQLRRLLACTTLAQVPLERVTFNRYAAWADMPETTRLKKTIDTWWAAIEVFITTRITNAKTEAANVTIKNIKRCGRGYRSHTNYQCRIMLYNTAPMAA